MTSLQRPPCASLAPYVGLVWASRAQPTDGPELRLERVLPTGAMHLVVRVSGDPLVLFDDRSGRARRIGRAVLGGARSSFYVKRTNDVLCTVGAQLRPGAARGLLGVPGRLFAEDHTRLDELWGGAVGSLEERLAEQGSLEGKLLLFERFLSDRVAARLLPGWVGRSLALFEEGASVAEAVHASGYSHRRFLSVFHEEVGLTPKVYARIRRFQRVITGLRDPGASLAAAAVGAGYADQAHLCRELRELAGVSPRAYRAAGKRGAPLNHLPIEGLASDFFKTYEARLGRLSPEEPRP